jgi:renalase
MTRSVAVIGAGVCGSVCAWQLGNRGHAVTVFDKGRGAGGRVSSRRTDSGQRFDHGAARFEVKAPEIHDALRPFVESGVIERADGVYWSRAGLSALCRGLLDGATVCASTRIVRADRGERWSLSDEAGRSFGPFDAVVSAVPPVNAAEFIAGVDPSLAQTVKSVEMMPCWVAMLSFARRLDHVADDTIVDGHTLRRSVSNTIGDALVVEAALPWSLEHVELDAETAGRRLYESVRAALAEETPVSIVGHRWRYAFAKHPPGVPLFCSDDRLVVGGDWCLGTSIESAMQSGLALADAIDRR